MLKFSQTDKKEINDLSDISSTEQKIYTRNFINYYEKNKEMDLNSAFKDKRDPCRKYSNTSIFNQVIEGQVNNPFEKSIIKEIQLDKNFENYIKKIEKNKSQKNTRHCRSQSMNIMF